MKRILVLMVLSLLLLVWAANTCFAWSLEDTKFKGDLRLRYDYGYREITGKDDLQRHRFRGRLRFGLETKVHEKVKVGFRIVGGDTDPRTTNSTYANWFATGDARIDQAYASIMATEDLKFLFGKFPKPFMLLDDLMWDGDIMFQGVSGLWSPSTDGSFSGFFNAGSFVLDEDKSSSKDPYMYYLQPGIGFDAGGNASVKASFIYYGFEHVKGMEPSEDFSSDSNTLDDDGRLVYDYDSYGANLVFKYGPGVSDKAAYLFTLVGDYIYNPDPKDSGYLFAVKFGNSKVANSSTWVLHYNYRNLERDAVMDVFPDSDSYGGKTAISGHEFIAQYAVVKNVIFGIDYYNDQRTEGDKDPQNLLQFDCVFKF